VREELLSGKRLVAENASYIAATAYASRFPFETWIIPKTHVCHFESIDKDGIADLAKIMKTVMVKIEKAANNPPLNYIIHTTPLNDGENTYYHWHIEIMPKLSHVAGFESGTGFYINPLPPETAARLLNEV
jgi:UDPglucose--hexose-1-phosphate uridylyltransferase